MNTAEALNDYATRLQTIATDLGLTELGETIVEDTERRLSDSRIRAVVLGEIKQGKSTLINALLGKDILPTGVTPTTGATVIVREGDDPGPHLRRDDESRITLESERFNRLAKGPLTKDSETAPDDEGTLEYDVSGGVLPPSLELVDTPGINDIAKFRASVSRGELPRADILILTLDATQLLNRTEMAFLRDAVAAVGGLADSGATLLLAVNRIDLIAERERPRLVEYIEDGLSSLVGADGNKAFELFLTDARTASRDPDADTPGVAGVKKLRERLVELAAARREVLPLRARAGLVRHASLLGHNASVAAHALRLEAKTLRREIERFEDDLVKYGSDMTGVRNTMNALRDEILEESAKRQAEFRAELESSTKDALKTISMRHLTGPFAGALHDAYLQFASKEAEDLRTALDEMTRRAILAHSEQARRRLYHATLRLGFRGPTIYVDPPSAVLEAGLVAIGVAGTAVMYLGSAVTGLLMAIAGPLTTLVLREKSLRDARARALEELPKALQSADDAFRAQVRATVEKHMGALDEHLQLANVALGEQLRGVLAKAQARLEEIEASAPAPKFDDHDPTEPGRAKALSELHELERELSRIRTQLDALG
ncbi:MAG: dynamin family protein [Nannocystaceae bacterium]|nr:dynamin family protein [bacterium]